MKPGLAFEISLICLETAEGVVDFLRGSDRVGQQELSFEVLGRLVEDFEQILCSRTERAGDDVELRQSQQGIHPERVEPGGFF